MILFNKYRIISPVRFKIFLILLVITSFFAVLGVRALAIDKVSFEYIDILIEDGDTIWDIAREHYRGKSDIRKVVHDISILNNVEDSIIKPGDRLIIPIQ